ncbi:hypothetical protein D3C75_1187880 [compost metagenome]
MRRTAGCPRTRTFTSWQGNEWITDSWMMAVRFLPGASRPAMMSNCLGTKQLGIHWLGMFVKLILRFVLQILLL